MKSVWAAPCALFERALALTQSRLGCVRLYRVDNRREPMEHLPEPLTLCDFADVESLQALGFLSHEMQLGLAEKIDRLCALGAAGIAVLEKGEIVATGFVVRDERWFISEAGVYLVLDPNREVCLIAFEVALSHRGRGIYTRLLQALRLRYSTDVCVIYAECDNHASLRGIQRAGFEQVRRLRGLRLAGNWVAVRPARAINSHGLPARRAVDQPTV